jgi:hypothetical protein
VATFRSVFSGVFGGPGASPPEDILGGTFDGITWPRITVLAGLGGALDPGADYYHIGVGPGIGTGKIAGTQWVDITDDVQAITISRGRDSDLDSATPGTCTLVIDNRSGDYDFTNATGPYWPLIDAGVPVRVTAEWPLGVVYDRFYGELIDPGMDLGWNPTVTWACRDGLDKLSRAFLAATSPTFDGDRTGARVGRILDAAAWPNSLRSLDTGYTILGRTVLGEAALPLLVKVEQTEFGLIWCDGSGRVVFYDRHRASSATRSTTVQAAFTDTGGAAEVELTTIGITRGRELLFTVAHITRDPAPSEPTTFEDDTSPDQPVTQVATNNAAEAAYGNLSFPDQVGQLLRNDSEALAMAQYLADRFGVQANRIRELTVEAITQDRWAQLLPLRLLDRVSASRDYGPVTVASEALIQGMTETIRNDEQNAGWDFTFTTTPPPPTPDLHVIGTAQIGVAAFGW